MDETILQNDLVREALDWYHHYLQKKEDAEFRKIMRSVDGEYIENHTAMIDIYHNKMMHIEGLLKDYYQCFFDNASEVSIYHERVKKRG